MKLFRYTIIITLLLLLALTCIVEDVKGQEEDSLQWLSKFYGIGWPYGNCTSIPSNSSYQVTCDPMSGSVTQIYFNLNPPVDYGTPDPLLTSFNFPNLTKFVVYENSIPLLYPSNIMDKFTNLTNFQFLYIEQSNVVISIPDELFLMNPKFVYFYCSPCFNLEKANFALSSGQFTTISFTNTKMTNSSCFGSLVYPKLGWIFASFVSNHTFTVTQTQFPALTSLYLYLLDPSFIISNWNINSTIITNAVLQAASNKQINLDMDLPRLNSLTLTLGDGTVNLSKPLYQSVPNLNELFTNYFMYNYPSLVNLTKLIKVNDQHSNLTTTPYFPPSVKSIYISNSPLTQLSNNFVDPTQYYDNFIFLNDYSLIGTVPNVFCNVKTFNLAGTGITVIPDCMKCYYSQLKSLILLPSSMPPPPIQPGMCDIILSQPTFISKDGLTITISGSGFGWGFNSTDKSIGLNLIKPNAEFEYVIPTPFASNSATVYFSYKYNYSAVVSWSSAFISISNVTYTQSPIGKVIIDVYGIYNQNISHSIILTTRNGIMTYSATNIGLNQTQIVVDQYDVSLKVNNTIYLINEYTNASTLTTYQPSFPQFISISSLSQPNINPGSTVVITGSFSTNYHNTAKVILNNEYFCNISQTAPTSIQCQLPTTIPSGNTQLQINIAGFNTSYNYFMIQSTTLPTCQEYNYCSNHGTCNSQGTCDCTPQYSGESCQYPNKEDIVFQPNNTNTVASFQANGYQFNFTLITIQELNIRDELVEELKAINWTSTSTDYPTNTTIQYSLNTISPLLKVNTSIIFTNHSSIYQFGGVNHTLPSNSLKIAVSINGWSFKSPLNRLRVVFKTNMEEQNGDGCGNQVSKSSLLYDGTSKGLKYLKVQKNGVIFFGSFYDIVVVDNRPVYTVNQVINQTTPDANGQSTVYIGVMLPNCQQCLIDPDFSALIDTSYGQHESSCDPSNESSKSLTTQQIIGIAVGCGVAFIIACLVTIYYLRKRFRFIKSNGSLRMVSMK